MGLQPLPVSRVRLREDFDHQRVERGEFGRERRRDGRGVHAGEEKRAVLLDRARRAVDRRVGRAGIGDEDRLELLARGAAGRVDLLDRQIDRLGLRIP